MYHAVDALELILFLVFLQMEHQHPKNSEHMHSAPTSSFGGYVGVQKLLFLGYSYELGGNTIMSRNFVFQYQLIHPKRKLICLFFLIVSSCEDLSFLTHACAHTHIQSCFY